MTTAPCPACGAKGVAAVACWSPGSGPSNEPVGHCHACGWCRHHEQTGVCKSCGRTVARRSAWAGAEHLPKPRDMGAEEFGFRAGLFVLWKTRPASELTAPLRIFADWLQEQGRFAEEVAARADWRPYAQAARDPKGWWSWSVSAGADWVELVTTGTEHVNGVDRPIRHIDSSRARLTKSYHNGRWLLGWPPGFVRLTAPLYFDHTRWRVTVSANRTNKATPSKPIERVWPEGYSTLLAPYCEPVVSERVEDLGLFAGMEEEAA